MVKENMVDSGLKKEGTIYYWLTVGNKTQTVWRGEKYVSLDINKY